MLPSLSFSADDGKIAGEKKSFVESMTFDTCLDHWLQKFVAKSGLRR
jgi:hypothetical protein